MSGVLLMGEVLYVLPLTVIYIFNISHRKNISLGVVSLGVAMQISLVTYIP